CSALRNVDKVVLPGQPRLVGALKWATAAEANFGFDDRETFAAYRSNARESVQAAFEADLVAIVVTSFIRSLPTKRWEGSPTQMYEVINAHASDSQRKLKSWPTLPGALSGRIVRAAPLLRAQGIHFEQRRTHGGRLNILAQREDSETSP